MQERTIFDNLVFLLSTEERKALLEKLNEWKSGDAETVKAPEEEPAQTMDLKQAYEASGLWVKIVMFFKSVFTGREPLALFEERLLLSLWKRIDRNFPGLVSREAYELLPSFFEELDSLAKAASFFTRHLEQALVRNRPDFIAFLAGMLLNYTQEKLLDATNPKLFAKSIKSSGDKDIREKAEFRLDGILMDITKEERGRMYECSAALGRLKEIAFFPYGDIRPAVAGNGAAAQERTAGLCRLSNLLAGMREPPDRRTLQALFVFSLREDLEKEEANAEDIIFRQLERAESALNQIVSFPARLPLTSLLKLLTKNINFMPAPEAGADDWFVVYKQFWKRRLEHALSVFFAERKKKDLYKEALAFVKLNDLPEFSWYNSKTNEHGVSFSLEQSLAFVVAFLERVFHPEMNTLLKLILIDAQFYKDQNRTEFTDAYNGLLRIKDRILKLDASFAPEGSAGKAMAQVERDFLSGVLKTKRFDAIILPLEREAQEIIETVIRHADSLMKVLYGILYGEVGGKYDTLSNRVHLGGRENKSVLKSLAGIMEKLGALIDLLKNLRDLEKRTT